MALDKNDLVEIKNIVDSVVNSAISSSENRMINRIDSVISSSENRMINRIDSVISSSENRMTKKIDELESTFDGKFNLLNDNITKLDKKIDDVKTEIIQTLTEEIEDLGEINQAVFNRSDKIEMRVERLEAKIA